jgi:hypothetical protein
VRLETASATEARIRADLAAPGNIVVIETAGEGRALFVLSRGHAAIAADIAELAERGGWHIGGFSVERGRLDEVFRARLPAGLAELAN